MNRIIFIAAVFLLCPIPGFGADHKVQWKKATEHYVQKQYDSAAYYFEQIAALQPENAEVYYNLGNSYYRLNRIAPAVLNYQRALRINPHYESAQDNLAITQARISHNIIPAEDIFFIAWWKDLTAGTKATAWAIAAMVAFTLCILSLWARRYSAEGRRLPVQMPGILGFVSILFLVFGFVSAANCQRSPGAVVNESDAPLMNNDLKGKPMALIPEGTTVKVAGEKGRWVEVILPDGRTGWLLQAQISKI